MTGAAGAARYGAGLSEHPSSADAVAEVVGQVLDAVGPEPDLAVLFVSDVHRDALPDVTAAIREVLHPGVLTGVTAASVVGGRREVEHRSGMSLWAGRIGEATPVRLETVSVGGGWMVRGLPSEATESPRTLLLLADPFTFPADGFLDELAGRAAPLTVIGGLASAGRGPGENRLVLDADVHADGAVGVLLPAGAPVSTVVSQGCRPIGEPFVVTRADRNQVFELAGRRAVERLTEMVGGLDDDDRRLVEHGLHVGRVIDEHRAEFDRGDFLIRNLSGADPESGALVIGDVADVGSTIQFQVRDAETADEDLRAMLSGVDAESALLFTCNGRGRGLFGVADHDAELVADVVGAGASAGMFCAGELGPIGGRNFVHGFTASVALFGRPG